MYKNKNKNKNRFIYRINDSVFDSDKEYRILKGLGSGQYGNVLKVINKANNNLISAFKIFRNSSIYNENAECELNILKILNKLDNRFVVKLLNHFVFRDHFVIELELYYNNLYVESYKKNFNIKAKIVLSHNICKGLHYLKQNRIIHADLKPENILLKKEQSLEIVICDFGLSMIHKLNNKKDQFNIQTLWYRAPEVLFKMDYDYSIDIWSMGCIVFELFLEKPLFNCKLESRLYQLIIEFIGLPHDQFKDSVEYKLFCKSNWSYLHKGLDYDSVINVSQKKKTLDKYKDETIFPTIIYNTLKWNPSERLTIEECLKIFEINERFYLDIL